MERIHVEHASATWRALREHAPVRVVAIAEDVPGSAMAERLRWYKDADDSLVRQGLTERLAWSVCRVLVDSPELLDGVDVVTCPGSSRRSAPEAIVDLVPRLAARHRRLLRVDRPVRRSHEPEAFSVSSPLAGMRVLVFDDAYVTGATSLSAADALTAAGADVRAVMVAGLLTSSPLALGGIT